MRNVCLPPCTHLRWHFNSRSSGNTRTPPHTHTCVQSRPTDVHRLPATWSWEHEVRRAQHSKPGGCRRQVEGHRESPTGRQSPPLSPLQMTHGKPANFRPRTPTWPRWRWWLSEPRWEKTPSLLREKRKHRMASCLADHFRASENPKAAFLNKPNFLSGSGTTA